ncbi:ATP-NAD kinase-like domain-containing protein [Artemisia annua]|uniref:ATP-NAD kinase-like domain-containing protein n=1 Tax=Artemisia annua TaxID=35608 RepID=A0A2U1QMR4_ARTAN|nr:ATP-NAD kinase-like domain-containing protein [Artemisia annua]
MDRIVDLDESIIGGQQQELSSTNLSCGFFLDHVGEVSLTLNPHGLSWKFIDSLCNETEQHTTCLGIKLVSKHDTSISISDVYAVEFIDWGLVHETLLANSGCLLGHASEMYRFTVHGVERSKSQPSLWAPTVYTFGHVDKQTCQMWVNRMNTYLRMEPDRPKNLLAIGVIIIFSSFKSLTQERKLTATSTIATGFDMVCFYLIFRLLQCGTEQNRSFVPDSGEGARTAKEIVCEICLRRIMDLG